MAPIVTDVRQWILDNERFFAPPVCNKMLHQEGQLKSFFVGGPNIRKDFHLEEGEEFFFMLKGDMCLKVLEKGAFRDVHIKEGECFLLPGRIPHSPQRLANTVGLVVERQRNTDEKDCLRYFEDGKTEILYERWFHCENLGTQLPPIIQEFFASDECRTGKRGPGSFLVEAPYKMDENKALENPFSVSNWLVEHRHLIRQHGKLSLFDGQYKFEVAMFGPGSHKGCSDKAETLFWQWEGESYLQSGQVEEKLCREHTALVPVGESWTLRSEGFVLQIISSA